MEDVRDSFRPSTLGWLRGTAAGLGTAMLGIAGIALLVGTAGAFGGWPLALTGLALLIVLWKWIQNMAAKFEMRASLAKSDG